MVGYLLEVIISGNVNEFKCYTKYNIPTGVYANFDKTTKSTIHKSWMFPPSMEIGIHENDVTILLR